MTIGAALARLALAIMSGVALGGCAYAIMPF
jgi:hypothetical protein